MRGIRRPVEYEPLFRRFTEIKHPVSDRTIFGTYRDFLCFLALLGFNSGERVPLNEDKQYYSLEGRLFEEHKQSIEIIWLIALADARDVSVLQEGNEDRMLQIFEECILAGFKVMDQWIRRCSDDPVGDQVVLSGLRRDGYLLDQLQTPGSPDDVQF